jgi:ubiquinone/menaquinone biosynthesis C-methylase UbiE
MSRFTVAIPDSLPDRIAGRVRRRMFDVFMRRLAPTPADTVLDIGVTSDQTFASSNYFEALYPFPAKITAAGIEDASFLEKRHPGVKFVYASALALPFEDNSFDFVHASAVLEHVGSAENQTRMVAECLRVARRGICLTTPNRWFPIEMHTHVPLIHWLPPQLSRGIFRRLGYGFFVEERNLNLMTRNRLRSACKGFDDWTFDIVPMRVLGWTSNLMLFATANRTRSTAG